MQLNKPKKVRLALAAASCALLGPQLEQLAYAASDEEWVINTGTLLYDEQSRVRVIEPVISVLHNYAEDEFVSFRFVSDTMTGASPNGASPTVSEQTIPQQTSTGASGGGATTTTNTFPANTQPKNTFSDQRFAFGVDWQTAHSRVFRTVFGANASQENDYSSTGISLTALLDSEDRLTTWTLGSSISSDTITPAGGPPSAFEPLAAPSKAGEGEREDDEDNERGKASSIDDSSESVQGERKLLLDAMIGVTQVLHRRLLTQLNYSLGLSSGYLRDPYKIISRVDGNNGTRVDYVPEKRPDSRVRHSLYWKTVLHLPRDVVHVTYRYYSDDWSIRAHTADINYRFTLGEHLYVSPHMRYYKQTGANFFVHSLVVTQPLPSYASADLRLAAMETATAGVKVGYNFRRNTEFSVRVEKMRQWGNSHPDSAIGVQRQLDLFPQLNVMMYSVQLSLDY